MVKRGYDLLGKFKVSGNPRLQIPPLSQSMLHAYSERVLAYEFAVLEALSFNCWFELPYVHIEQYTNEALDGPTLSQLKQYAKFFANDSFRSNVGLHKSAEQIGEVCLCLSAEYLKLPMSFRVDEETYKNVKEIYNGKDTG